MESEALCTNGRGAGRLSWEEARNLWLLEVRDGFGFLWWRKVAEKEDKDKDSGTGLVVVSIRSDVGECSSDVLRATGMGIKLLGLLGSTLHHVGLQAALDSTDLFASIRFYFITFWQNR